MKKFKKNKVKKSLVIFLAAFMAIGTLTIDILGLEAQNLEQIGQYITDFEIFNNKFQKENKSIREFLRQDNNLKSPILNYTLSKDYVIEVEWLPDGTRYIYIISPNGERNTIYSSYLSEGEIQIVKQIVSNKPVPDFSFLDNLRRVCCGLFVTRTRFSRSQPIRCNALLPGGTQTCTGNLRVDVFYISEIFSRCNGQPFPLFIGTNREFLAYSTPGSNHHVACPRRLN
ncbi:MAG: hypothetical protein FWF50_04930 [Defluviitaleaceae bacterium]|nr:hypothetical protein [Defluviitaleaceae bacterium]